MNKVFSANLDFKKTAFLNWRTNINDDLSNMIVIAEGYKEVAMATIDNLLESNNRGNRADAWIFPILFNANHSIEVYLKNICWSLNRLLKKDETQKGNKFYFHHELDKHYKKMVELENEYQPNSDKKEFNSMIHRLNEYINELYEKTNDITFPRYTEGKVKGVNTPQFYVEELDNVEIDLVNLGEIYVEIFTNLDQLAYHFMNLLEKEQEHKQFMEEQARELESEFRDQ